MTMVDEPLGTRVVTRAEIEDFLYNEAALLDEWRLEEWLDLFTLDCVYEIPSSDTRGLDGGLVYSLIHDRRPLLEQRVLRLKKPTAHAEYPHSRTRRLVTNVRLLSHDGDGIRATANFAVFRSRAGKDVMYVGCYEYLFVLDGDALRIKHRTAVIEHESLDPHGKISIII
ncbi:aromatic-ring-hydroxylating dioxygenase subunit beta [Dactylosporangium sp. NPDC005572]|uniref:aromatic-ring-hydroxylating dioxygenase subunit beta n=1 Tax=Dactylosporangium sp. NPDC005572 TaxID=3156889 RepID=UPI0033A16F16